MLSSDWLNPSEAEQLIASGPSLDLGEEEISRGSSFYPSSHKQIDGVLFEEN